jgi:hypothetical protein
MKMYGYVAMAASKWRKKKRACEAVIINTAPGKNDWRHLSLECMRGWYIAICAKCPERTNGYEPGH